MNNDIFKGNNKVAGDQTGVYCFSPEPEGEGGWQAMIEVELE